MLITLQTKSTVHHTDSDVRVHLTTPPPEKEARPQMQELQPIRTSILAKCGLSTAAAIFRANSPRALRARPRFYAVQSTWMRPTVRLL